MSKIAYPILAAMSACLLSAPALAVDYVTGSVGDYNALRSGQDHTFLYGLEYRFDEWQYGIRPIVGGFGTAQGGAYGYAGFDWDVALLPNQFYLVPNFAVGAYHDGGGKKLGGTLEFRSGIEVDYQFPNTQQVGVALNHISNAGIYNHNPGEETVLVNYSIPVGTISSWIGR